MLIKRYTGRPSFLTLNPKKSTAVSLKRLSYHFPKKQVETASDSSAEDALDDVTPVVDEFGVSSTLTNVTNYHNKSHKDIQIPAALSGAMIPLPYKRESEALLLQKLDFCCLLCDFSDNEADRLAKKMKSAALTELQTIITDYIGLLSMRVTDKIFEVFNVNLSRNIPPIPPIYLSYDDEPLIYDVNWPHLSLIYSLIETYISIRHDDPHFTEELQHQLLSLLHSCDPNEREAVIKILSPYIDAFPDREAEIWKEMEFFLIGYEEGNYYPFCVMPILKFLSERADSALMTNRLFHKAIVPLISTQHILTFSELYVTLCKSCVNLGKASAIDLVTELIKRFPKTSPSKQLTYIQVQNDIIELLQAPDFEKEIGPIFKLYSRISLSQNPRVIGKSMQIWQSVKLIPLMVDNSKAIFPLVYKDYLKVMNNHWSKQTQTSVMKVMRSMRELDSFTFDEVARIHGNAAPVEESARHRKWALIARMAASTDKSVNLVSVLAEIQKKFVRTPSFSAKKPKIVSPGRSKH